MGALGSFFNNLYVRLGLRKTPAAGEPVASPAEDDFVARHGRSYGEALIPFPPSSASSWSA
jgi:hypothetical protein